MDHWTDLIPWFVAAGVIIGFIAAVRGRNPVGWFVYGVLLFPIALIHVLISQSQPRATAESVDTSRAKCPHCAESIMKEANVCPHCQRDLPAGWSAPAEDAGKDETADMRY